MSARRVLVVEDEMLVAMLLEDMLVQMGFEVIGPALRLRRALEIATGESFDFALLDVNLAGERSYPVADILLERGIPFIFATGYGSPGLDGNYKKAVTLQKPFGPQQLEHAIASAISPGARG